MKHKPENKEELEKLVNDESIHLGDIDTSLITDMSHLFENTERKDFSGIENWDVSRVENMAYMFSNAESFNQPIGNWDVSKVENMREMFSCARSFNQDISNWDVSNVKNICEMFREAKSFNQDISNWDVSRSHRGGMFWNIDFNEKFKPKALQNNQRKHNRGRGG